MSSRKCVFPTEKKNASPPVVLVRSSLKLHPVWNTMSKVSFFTKLWELDSAGQCFEVQNVFSQTVSRCLCRKRYQKFYFFRWYTYQCLFLSTDNLTRPFSSSVSPNCWHQSAAAPQILSWLTEWIVQNKSCVFAESPLECMLSLPFFFRIPRLKALILLNTGWPDSVNRCTILSAMAHSPLESKKMFIPLLIPTQDLETFSVLARISSRILWLFWIRNTNSIVTCLCPIMSLNVDMKMIRSLNSSGLMFFLAKPVWISWRTGNDEKSCENIPLEFNCFSIDSHCFLVGRGPSLLSCIIPKHKTESE